MLRSRQRSWTDSLRQARKRWPRAPKLSSSSHANILINLLRIGQLTLLGELDAYRFLVPDEVVDEITDPAQSEQIASAIAAGYLEKIAVDTMEALGLFADLRDVMARG